MPQGIWNVSIRPNKGVILPRSSYTLPASSLFLSGDLIYFFPCLDAIEKYHLEHGYVRCTSMYPCIRYSAFSSSCVLVSSRLLSNRLEPSISTDDSSDGWRSYLSALALYSWMQIGDGLRQPLPLTALFAELLLF